MSDIRQHNEDVLKTLKPGDLVEFNRVAYVHWGVFTGSGSNKDGVVHMTSDSSSSSFSLSSSGDSSVKSGSGPDEIVSFKDREAYIEALKEDLSSKSGKTKGSVGGSASSSPKKKKAIIKEESFWKIAGKSKTNKNNSLDSEFSPRSAEETVRVAMEWIGYKLVYHLLYFNCEHFSHLCRNGAVVSKQVWIPTGDLKNHVEPELFEQIMKYVIYRDTEAERPGVLSLQQLMAA